MISQAKKLCRRIENEYRGFRNSTLAQGKNVLWDKCHKIYFYCNIAEYFRYNEVIPEKYVEALMKHRHPIGVLWESYLKNDEASISTWDGIEELLEMITRNGGKCSGICKTGTC